MYFRHKLNGYKRKLRGGFIEKLIRGLNHYKLNIWCKMKLVCACFRAPAGGYLGVWLHRSRELQR